MKEGKIVEEGTFDELCLRGGEFTRLWTKYAAQTRENEAESIKAR